MDQMNRSPAVKGGTHWWKLYLTLVPRRNEGNSVQIPYPTVGAYTLALFLLSASMFLSMFLLTSNEQYLDHSVDSAMARATTREQRERLELTREANKQILLNPGIRVIIATKITMRYSISFAMSLALFWLSLAGMSGRWDGFLGFWLVAMSSTGVLLLGVILMFLCRWFFFLTDYNLSLALLLRHPDFSGVLFNLLSHVDPFNTLFLWVISSRLSILYREHVAVLFVTFLSILIIEILISSLLHADFFFVS